MDAKIEKWNCWFWSFLFFKESLVNQDCGTFLITKPTVTIDVLLNVIWCIHIWIVQLFSWQNLVDEKLIWGSDDRGGANQNKGVNFCRKNVKKTFSLAFFKKILFQNISWYTDIFASVPLHAPPPPCQYFLSVPLVVKQNRQMSSQLVSKASATANVLKSDNL